MSKRLSAGERLDTPLLITNLTNIFYLTGFDSSNAALLVEPGGTATLYTDFRYIESARGGARRRGAADEARADAGRRRAPAGERSVRSGRAAVSSNGSG